MNDDRFKILVVDDERPNLDVLNEMLKNDYRVIIAKSGAAALERAERDNPDLILLDIVMPGMDGFEVLASLKKSEKTMRIPVICITGLDNVADEEKGLAIGAVDYITKPFHRSIVLARIATHLRIVEQIRFIEQLGLYDALTKIPNRRSFDNHLATEWGRANREKTPISLLMVDVDHFKQLNDSYGHQHGDAVLQELAVVMKSVLKRAADFLARWGGEEFAVLLPQTDLKGAREVAEQIRAGVEAAGVYCADATGTKTTVSVGVNAQRPVPETALEEFIHETDKRLYQAKEAGRNRIFP
jgi:diguanylate cyclase (GGDEF)-like protein